MTAASSREPDGTIEVVPYDPAWPALFEAEWRLLATALPMALAIEHVGSTSVPGLAAKPTIDILAVLPSAEGALSRLDALSEAGYDYRPGSFVNADEHLYFRKVRDGKRLAHLHVLSADAPEVDEYRLFRDFLIANPDAVRRYEVEKFALLLQHPGDRMAYVDGKSPFVDTLLVEARAWRDRS